MRGEQTKGGDDDGFEAGSPPLARGTAAKTFILQHSFRITPACAGNSRPCCGNTKAGGDHPRLRGEQPLQPSLWPCHRGSPPLARGTEFCACRCILQAGITPACAGNRWMSGKEAKEAGDHPRLRGEQIRAAILSGRDAGSPPLARGTVVNVGGLCDNGGITPACAGNSNTNLRICIIFWDHPRLRGEQTIAEDAGEANAGSPPLARGPGFCFLLKKYFSGITPACAGNRLKKDLLYLVFYNIVFHFSISFS